MEFHLREDIGLADRIFCDDTKVTHSLICKFIAIEKWSTTQENFSSGLPTRLHKNWPVQQHKMARTFKFWTEGGEGLYYSLGKSTGVDQLGIYCSAHLCGFFVVLFFCICEKNTKFED